MLRLLRWNHMSFRGRDDARTHDDARDDARAEGGIFRRNKRNNRNNATVSTT